MAGNREYKSDVFSMLMEDKRNALQVYNALNQTAYDDPNLIKVHTLNKGVSLSVRNDAAFVVDSSLSVYEHQSTVCPNMPLRCLLYVSNILKKIVKDYNIYGKSLVKIPTPKFAVFYNGKDDFPEQQVMKLSDAFECPADKPELELTCKVYNINSGYNRELLENCQVLREYMIFVDYVRMYHGSETSENMEDAINLAIDRCIQEGILKEFLRDNRSEVVKVMQMDYTFERQIQLEYAAGHAEGQKQGEESILIKQIQKKLAKGLSAEEIADALEITVERSRELLIKIQAEHL